MLKTGWVRYSLVRRRWIGALIISGAPSLKIALPPGANARDDVADVVNRRRLVDGDADRAIREIAEVDARCLCGLAHDRRVRAGDVQGIEVGDVGLLESRCDEGVLERPRHAVNALADRAQPVRAVKHRIHRRDVREQRLRGADVGRRLLAADVLFARGQRHAIGAAAAGVDGYADDAPRRLADEGLARREERGVRPAVAERYAEALRVADDGVGAHLSRRRQQRQRHQVAGDGDEQSRGVRLLDDRREVAYFAVIVRILQQQAEGLRPSAATRDRRLRAGCRAARALPFRTSSVCGNVRDDTRNTDS